MVEASGTLTEWPYFVWEVKHLFSTKRLEVRDITVRTTQFKLSLAQNCFKDTDEDCLELCLECKPEADLEFHTTVYLRDTYENDHFVQNHVITLQSPAANIGANYFNMRNRKCIIWTVERKAILAEYEALEHPGGAVHIIIVTGSGSRIIQDQEIEKVHKSVQLPFNVGDVPCLESLSLDFRRYLVKGEPDMVIVCGDINFSFHKAVLSARSRVFAEMLHQKTPGDGKLTIVIKDMQSSVFKQFLRYIHCGRLPHLTEDLARHLYVAGCKYTVDSLRKKCSNFMLERMTEKNAPSLLLLADAHKDLYFKNNIVSFITKNDEILKGEIWINFSGENKMLAFGVYQVYFKRFASKHWVK